MWKPAVAVAALVAMPALAHAERSTALSVTGGVAVMGDADDIGPNRMGSLVGASLAWDRPAPDYPESGTAVARGDLVPEVTLFSYGDRGGLLAGLRLELDIAQRHMGLFRVSARMSAWLAPRIGIIQGADGALVGGDFGEMFYLGRSGWAVGVTMGMLTWREGGSVGVPTPVGGTIAFQPEAPGSQQLAITMGLIVAH
jgi:hypothetical protein